MYYTQKNVVIVFEAEMDGKNALGNQSKYEYDDHYRMNHSIIT